VWVLCYSNLKGGPDSIYGIGLTETKRFLNTFENPDKTYAFIGA
jgi:hypothetical protein